MRFARNLAIFAAADMLGSAIGLIASPITTRLLTQEQYGAAPLLAAVWAFAALVQYGGMDWSFPYFRARPENDEREVTVTATSIAVGSAVLTWGLFCVTALATGLLADYADIDTAELLAYLLGVLPTALLGWVLYLLRFKHRAAAFARVTLLGRVAGLVVGLPIIYLLPQEHRLIGSFAVGAAFALLALMMGMRELKQDGIQLRPRRDFSSPLGRRMLRYGLALVPGGAVYAMMAVVDRLIAGYFLGPSGVAVLALAVSIASVALLLKGWFARTWDPHLVEWIATGDARIYVPNLQRALGVLAPAMFGLAAMAALWSEDAVKLLYPAAYLPAARLIPILVLSGAVSTLSLIAVATVMIAHTPRWHLPIYSAAFCLSVGLSMTLIPRYGLPGAAAAALAAELLILFSWIALGIFYYRNLRLRWLTTGLLLTATTVGCLTYRPGVLWPGARIAELAALSAAVIAAVAGLVLPTLVKWHRGEVEAA